VVHPATIAEARLKARAWALALGIGLRASHSFAAPDDDSAYRHEKFRGRLDLAIGTFYAKSATEGANDRTFSGTTFSWGVFVGGAVGGTCALGGTLSGDRVYGLAAYDAGTGAVDVHDLSFAHVMWGPALDCYFSEKGGLRVFAALGPSDLNVGSDREQTGSGGDPTPDPSGFGYQLAIGYDAFVAKELSLGLFARLTYAPLSVNETGATGSDVSLFVPSLGLSLSLD
jgi:hypothetical protein